MQGLFRNDIVEHVLANSEPNYGFNAETGRYGNLIEDGEIDPTKVTRTALQNAASIASLMLTTEALVFESLWRGRRCRRKPESSFPALHFVTRLGRRRSARVSSSTRTLESPSQSCSWTL
jgi:hypothetical protein